MSTEAQWPSGASAPAKVSTHNTSITLAAPATATAAVRAPRENALRHGLTADALIERMIGDEVYRALVDSLVEEFDALPDVEVGLTPTRSRGPRACGPGDDAGSGGGNRDPSQVVALK